MKSRIFHLRNFAADHLFCHGLSAKLSLVKDISLRILCHNVEFTVFLPDRIIIIVFADFFKRFFQQTAAVQTDQILPADCFKNTGYIF